VAAPAPVRPEIELHPGALVICDLHLDLSTEDGAEGFVTWLNGLETQLPQLIVLGDLFDVWVGPAQSELPGAPSVLDALARLTERGTETLVIHGNRDFLLDASFERRTGTRIVPDGFVGVCGDKRVLFVHGDELCTLDTNYLRLRAVVRSRPVLWLAPRIPLPVATRIARRLRRASTQALVVKPVEEKSMQLSAAEAVARETRADLVVCGHAHEYRVQELASGARWIVLDAFGGEHDVLHVAGAKDLRAVSSGR
jgi:UDP-2,3-diacylglucosamine hydrolase